MKLLTKRAMRSGRCGCCGRDKPLRNLTPLQATPAVMICHGCALWAAERTGRG